MELSSIDLKPCPVCGKTPEVRDYFQGVYCQVVCPNCMRHTKSGNLEYVVREWNKNEK